MLKRFLSFLKTVSARPTPEERYLAGAENLYDLERRMRQVELGMGNNWSHNGAQSRTTFPYL